MSDPLYFNSSNSNETIESVLKKVLRVNEDGEVYFAINFLSNLELFFDELDDHPDAHDTKGTLYSYAGKVWFRDSVAEGGEYKDLTRVIEDRYQGSATTATDPGASVAGDYYYATETGTYTNFNNLNATFGDKLVYDGAAWEAIPQVPFPEIGIEDNAISANRKVNNQDNIVPAEAMLMSMRLENSGSNPAELKIGTTSGGNEIAEVMVPAGKFIRVVFNKEFSLSSATTLYISSDSWSGVTINSKTYIKQM